MLWDVFISYAREDRETIARPLANALSRAGLKVWYDESELKLGDSLGHSISRGISQSRYAIVILSPNFFAKMWPQGELDRLTTREPSSGRAILPIWHDVTLEDIKRFSPILANRLGVSTARGLDTVVGEILRVVRPEMTITFLLRQLSELLKTRKGKYILFLGAGATVSSGSKTTREIVTDIIEKYKLDSHDPWNSFCTFLRRKSENERFDILSKYFEDMEPSVGYKILARLIEEGYFRLILTTNIDYMLEEALKETKLVLNRDYFVCSVGEGREDILTRKLEDESMIRIVKLHGDYKSRILPFTEEETFQFNKEVEKHLKRLTKESIVFVGYSSMDRDVLKCLSRTGESIWWVNPRKVTADKTIAGANSKEYKLNDVIYEILINRNSHNNFIWGEDGKSDVFFEMISQEIFKRDINSFCDLLRFGATRYRKMKDLFEPPYQYEEMKQKLEKNRVLLILGEPHIGNTYTALNLLYDYYVEGFDIDYKSGLFRRDLQYEMLYEWEKLLRPNTVFYFEDPFGKTEPENILVFRSEFKKIIERIQNSQSLVIITSRLSIFKEIGDLNEFPMIVELMKHDISYDLEKRKRIIDRYVSVYKPKWQEQLNEKHNEETLKEYIARELTEPHNIDLFFEKSLNINDFELLLRKVEESKKIFEVFKQEIRRNTTSGKIFFYICYIFRGWRGDFELAKNSYSRVLRYFGLDPYEYDFSKLLGKYDFRVETYVESGLRIKFSHPDFSKAIEESFNKNISILGRILLELARDEDSSVRWSVAETITENFEMLPEEYRRLLFDLARDRDENVRTRVAETVVHNFEMLPEDYRRLLFDLAKDRNENVRTRVAETVVHNFEMLPEEYRRLLFDLAKDRNENVRTRVAETVIHNFEMLPEEYRRLLFDLAKDRETHGELELDISYAEKINVSPNMAIDFLLEIFQSPYMEKIDLENIGLQLKDNEISSLFSAFSNLLKEEKIPENLKKAKSSLNHLKKVNNSKDLYIFLDLIDELGSFHGIEEIAYSKDLLIQSRNDIRNFDASLTLILDLITEISENAFTYSIVSDLGDQLYYISNGMSLCERAQENILEKLHRPYSSLLERIMIQWRTIHLEAIENLRRTAKLSLSMESKHIVFSEEITALLNIRNEGASYASNVRVSILPSSEYSVIDGVKSIRILSPYEESLLEFRIRPIKREKIRVVFQIQYDDLKNKGLAVEFADVMSFFETKGVFRKIENPYIAGHPVKIKKMFYGRKDIFRYIRENIHGKYQNNTLILHGQRKTGKTSILLQLVDGELPDQYIPIFIDFQNLPDVNTSRFFFRLQKAIFNGLMKRGIDIHFFEIEEFEKNPYITFDSFLEECKEHFLENQTLVLLFDEFEEIEKKVEKRLISSDVVSYLRSLIQHQNWIVVIFTGTHKLTDMAGKYWSVLFNIALHKKIGFLRRDEAIALIRDPVAGEIEFDDLAVEKILRVTANHPYFIQLVCYSIVEYLNDLEAKNYVTLTDVNKCLDSVIERGTPHFSFVWKDSGVVERVLMSIMASVIGVDKPKMMLNEIERIIRGRRILFDGIEIKEALRSLSEKDILQSEKMSPGYSFKVDLIRMWIAENKPLNKVIQEEFP